MESLILLNLMIKVGLGMLRAMMKTGILLLKFHTRMAKSTALKKNIIKMGM